MASKPHGTLYVGVTRDLIRRVYQHRNNLVEGFTKQYDVHSLVYYEVFVSIEQAILREKQIKKWKRKWKCELIEKENIAWADLYSQIVG